MSSSSLPHPWGYDALARWAPRVPRWQWLVGAAASLVVLALALIFAIERAHPGISYTTAPVVVQTLTQSVTASGTVNPQNSISVGTQVSGTIASIDVDFNSKVTKGEVLARIDPSTFQAQLDQAQASLAQAQAQAAAAGSTALGGLSSVTIATANNAAQNAATTAAQANIAKAQSALVLAQLQEKRDASLSAQGYLAQSQLDADRSTTAQDQAALAAAQAAFAQARAQAQASTATIALSSSTARGQNASAQAAAAAVQLAQASVQQDQLNLSHTIITSPVNGTVVARAVSVGQTVAASFSTPTLFTIAQNLQKMEVDINVGEPDIGNVRARDSVAFSVLAYPSRTFQGTVAQVRINPQTLNNVVTYDVVVDVPNPDGALLPGMTANATIDIASAKNALVVPLAALSWKPSSAGAAANGTSPWGTLASGSGTVASAPGTAGMLFVLHNGRPQHVAVRVLLATSTQAAVAPVTAGALSSGDEVITAATGSTASARKGSPRSPVSGGMRVIH
ncbi:MAG: efflux RND transporter periplasmic adaptor subunit [Candidatus Eremiobacteraeota bacterium]|nr:efflux RND transporter periplasmic adaptor subunit [Candidatus Eremiobacteraeota bacterium]